MIRPMATGTSGRVLVAGQISQSGNLTAAAKASTLFNSVDGSEVHAAFACWYHLVRPPGGTRETVQVT